MKRIYLLPLFVITLLILSCGDSADKAKEETSKHVEKAKEEVAKKVEEVTEEVTEAVVSTLTNVGVGEVKELKLEGAVDETLAAKGKDLFASKGCTACHNPTMRIVGPAIEGVFERRNPAWIMNMIMDPTKMLAEDEDAKALLVEYNNVPMTNQGITKDEARAIVEYFRTI